jgi:hypothetical protein
VSASTTRDGASWAEFAAQAPGLADAVAARFEANRHHLIATLRPDGSPRLSGTEVDVTDGQELRVGMMPASHKLADVARDPRVEIHTAPLEPDLQAGDAKVAGTLVETGRVDGGGAMFALRIGRVSLVRVDGDELVFQVWRSGAAVRTIRRR